MRVTSRVRQVGAGVRPKRASTLEPLEEIRPLAQGRIGAIQRLPCETSYARRETSVRQNAGQGGEPREENDT